MSHLRKFIIERDIPAVGSFEREQLKGAAAKSNEVLAKLGPDIQWQESYVAADKTFCVYLAKDEAIIRKHAETERLPRDQDHRSPQDDRPDDGEGRGVTFNLPLVGRSTNAKPWLGCRATRRGALRPPTRNLFAALARLVDLRRKDEG